LGFFKHIYYGLGQHPGFGWRLVYSTVLIGLLLLAYFGLLL